MIDAYEVERTTLTTGAGKKVELWGIRPDTAEATPTVLISPGFGTKMVKYAMFARTLVANGIACYRFDSADHVGLSDGEMQDYTLSTLADSTTAATEFVLELDGGPTSLVAFSLSFRAGCRVARTTPELAHLIGVVGVVDVRSTIATILGHDHSAEPVEAMPERIDIEGHLIDGPRFLKDCLASDWLGPASTTADLAAIAPNVGVSNLCAGGDEWVPLETVESVFNAARPGSSTVYGLPHAQHDLSQSPLAAAAILETLVESIVTPGAAFVAPSLDELRAQAVHERALANTGR